MDGDENELINGNETCSTCSSTLSGSDYKPRLPHVD